ncbi:hypothetical protein BD779DRAFT_1583286 [Infundibulicybe gibba]|nr:hypothetical protein BD779DRAFT_1583286 [Infundibulicybe gibba]
MRRNISNINNLSRFPDHAQPLDYNPASHSPAPSPPSSVRVPVMALVKMKRLRSNSSTRKSSNHAVVTVLAYFNDAQRQKMLAKLPALKFYGLSTSPLLLLSRTVSVALIRRSLLSMISVVELSILDGMAALEGASQPCDPQYAGSYVARSKGQPASDNSHANSANTTSQSSPPLLSLITSLSTMLPPTPPPSNATRCSP